MTWVGEAGPAAILLYDTTLRDGTQAEDIAFSVEDKLRIAHALDSFGIAYVEGGWPGSNPRDAEFFRALKGRPLGRARAAAFGATCRAGARPRDDVNLRALIEAETEVVTIFGKAWELHARTALGVSAPENADLIESSVRFLKARVGEVIFDAEHFFDGWRDDPEYALAMVRAAAAGGADWIVLCDTNGGSLPDQIQRGVLAARGAVERPLGIHCHNDAELAVANSLAAVAAGARQVQGTINGYGERCGNANLISIAANLALKLGRAPGVELLRLRELAALVAELANRPLASGAAYVGKSAFAHKGGVHVSAVVKDARTYEHVEPEVVGNQRRVLVSDLSGRANVMAKARECGIDLDEAAARAALGQLKALEAQGYQFEGAEASFELLLHKARGQHAPAFALIGYRVVDEKRALNEEPRSEATIQVEVAGEREHTAADGHGPVHALDRALRKALERFYPSLREVKLIDYKVRVIPAGLGTAAVVRVLVESTDGRGSFTTVGVSEDILEASFRALTDAIEYKLLRDRQACHDARSR
ncbi:MAG TPA: citramalate synthase [Polyangia bacterium]|nr:citramalate synthase [Polyangia bacterium]